MRIGFFGDSFCADISSNYDYKSYIELLQDHYSADICSLGDKGASVWDVILLQFPKFLEDPPDVCIFVWTTHSRVFHRTERTITPNNWGKDTGLQQAVELYYKHLFDEEKSILELSSALMHFDQTVLSKVNSKIIHLWAFGKLIANRETMLSNPYLKDVETYYTFKNGTEVNDFFLLELAIKNTALDALANSSIPNHIAGDEQNHRLFNTIKQIIDNQ
jgi:hypothetical protein